MHLKVILFTSQNYISKKKKKKKQEKKLTIFIKIQISRKRNATKKNASLIAVQKQLG